MIKDPDNFSTFLPRCGKSEIFGFLEDLRILWRDAELKSVVDGYRDVGVFYLDQQDFDNQLNKLADLGLMFQPLIRIKSFDGFGHKHEISEKIDGNTSIYGAVSKTQKSLKQFKEFYSEGDEFNIGVMLGYPECCSRSYSDYVRRGIIDPVFEISENTPMTTRDEGILNTHQIPWQLQIHLRYFGLKIIPFFPCSLVCDKALSVSEEWYDILKSIDPGTLATLESLMKQSSIWSLYNSQIVVNQPPFKADFFGYVTSSYYPGKMEVQFLDVQ